MVLDGPKDTHCNTDMLAGWAREAYIRLMHSFLVNVVGIRFCERCLLVGAFAGVVERLELRSLGKVI